MFVRKGTTLRKKHHQSMRKPRRTSLPAQLPAQPDPELGEASSSLGTPQRMSTASSSNTSSVMTLNEEKTLVGGSGYVEADRYKHIDYGSMLLQLREAKDESVSVLDFLQRCQEIIWQSLILTVLLILLLGLPISMIAMGTSYLEDCPREPRLPIYLLVGGAFSFIHICILIWQQKRTRDYMLLDDSRDDDDNDEDDVMRRSYRFTGHILSVFLLIWFCLGNVWFFSIGKPNFKQPLHEPGNWCSRNLYTFAFYQLMACYSILAAAFLVSVGCLLAYLCGLKSD